MQPIIEVKNVSKKYDLGEFGSGYLFRAVQSFLAKLFKKQDPNQPVEGSHPALKNIELQIQPNEKIALMGPNGSGKTTLLKMISRVSVPSEGSIRLSGKSVCLLEPGVGFHSELTGFENIFLHGALLGAKKKEIKKKLDQIIEFSELEPFINTPVKRYSSGMWSRLSLAVALHLDADFWIFDEVFEHLDTDFKDKCLKKISQENMTVVFATHQAEFAKSLGARVVQLENGAITN